MANRGSKFQFNRIRSLLKIHFNLAIAVVSVTLIFGVFQNCAKVNIPSSTSTAASTAVSSNTGSSVVAPVSDAPQFPIPFTNDARLFNGPSAVAVDSSGTSYIVDTGNNRIQICTDSGVCSQSVLESGTFNSPAGIAVDSLGFIYVADTGNNMIQKCSKVSSSGTTVTLSCAQFGNLSLNAPQGVTVDSSNNVYIADTGNNYIYKCLTASHCIQNTGTAFSHPTSIAVAASGGIYVADSGNQQVQSCTFSNNILNCAAFTYPTASPTPTPPSQISITFSNPVGIAVDANSNLYVTDIGNNTIQKYNASGFYWTPFLNGEGTATGYVNNPKGIAVSSSGQVFIADASNNRVQNCSPTGGCSIIGQTSGSSLGYFNEANSFALDGAGNIFVADTTNNRVQKCALSGACVLVGGGGTSLL